MVTFDKGGRAIRLQEGAHLDARQTGILFARLTSGTSGQQGRILDWDRDHNPAATKRMDELLATKGPDHKQTLLLALSMSVLTRFEVVDSETGERYVLAGERSGGYTVVDVQDR